MAKIKIEKDNVILSIEEEDFKQYEARGYSKLGASKKDASKDLDKQISKLEKTNEALTKQLGEKDTQIEALTKQLGEKDTQIEALTKQLGELKPKADEDGEKK